MNHKIFLEALVGLAKKNPEKWLKRWKYSKTCSDYQTMGLNKETDKSTIITGGFCKDRLCPVCLERGRYKFVQTFCKILNYNQRQNPEYCEEMPVDVDSCFYTTFSIGHVPLSKLAETTEKLRKGFAMLQKRKAFKTMSITGTITHLFVDWNPQTDLWHPHIVILCKSDVDEIWKRLPVCQRNLNSEWSKIKRDMKIAPKTLSIRLSRITDDPAATVATFNKPTFQYKGYLTQDLQTNMAAIETLDSIFSGLHTIEYTGTLRDMHNRILETPIEHGGLQKPEGTENFTGITRLQYKKDYYTLYSPAVEANAS